MRPREPRIRSCTLPVAIALAFFLTGCRKPATPAAKRTTLAPETTTIVDDAPLLASQKFAAKGYVGSMACSNCHAEIAASYANHSMGKSAAPLTADTPFPAAENSRFEADGFRYEMKNNGENWAHHQSRIAGASELAKIDLAVTHVIGSGKNGQSFLVERENHLFMSPMTWYPSKGVWDLSPGYEKNNSQFNRPVIEECLYCHTDGAHAIHTSTNQYESPIFHAHEIGCERCHGPGKNHVATQQVGTDDVGCGDSTIVNPAKLTPELREAVCQQCHLSGAIRVPKPNRTLHDFQPGQPLSSAYTIFTMEQDGKEFVGHVEQMYQSKCFQTSDGQLGCISCHDPHSLPAAAVKAQFYRDRCITCHKDDGCSLETDKRLAISTEDNCVECHMPKRDTEIRHAAVTDHSVPRQATLPTSGTSSKAKQLLAFPDEATANSRDKAIGLSRMATQIPDLLGDATFKAVLATLEEVAKNNPSDFLAADALAELYLADKRVGDALRVCQEVLSEEPRRESTLLIVCETYSRTGQHQEAATHWERIMGVNPWMAKYWYSLGGEYAALRRWKRCEQLALEGKKRFPTSMGLRHLLVEANLQLGNLEAAEVEFQEIVEFRPPKLDSLKTWFESHPARRKAVH